MNSSLSSAFDPLLLKIAQIKLLVLDVDGILTDGHVYLLPNGEEVKCFNIHDGFGMRQLMQAGIPIAIITGRSSQALTARMQELQVPYIYQNCHDKLTTLHQLCQQLKLSLLNIAYAGDDIPDYEAMQAVGMRFTAANAVTAIKSIADYCTHAAGGKGAVREICDYILAARLSLQSKNLENHSLWEN